MVPSHRFVAADDILQDRDKESAEVRAPRRERGAVVENKFRLIRVFGDGALKGVLPLPPFDDAVLKGGEIWTGLNLTEGVLLAHVGPVPIAGS
jgi:hypothetical protein